MDWEDEMSSRPRVPRPVIVQPPKIEDLDLIATKAAEVQALKARRRRKMAGTMITGPEGVGGIAAVKRKTLGA